MAALPPVPVGGGSAGVGRGLSEPLELTSHAGSPVPLPGALGEGALSW